MKMNLDLAMVNSVKRRTETKLGRPLTNKERRDIVSNLVKKTDKLLARKPWQLVESKCKNTTGGGWWIGTPLAYAWWKESEIPCEPVRIYMVNMGDHYVARGLLDAGGYVHQAND
jgi:hypothetical protein